MNSKAILLALFVSMLILPGTASAQITCTAKSSCSGGEAHIMDMSAQTNAHAANAGQGPGYIKLCCSGHGIQAGTSGDYDQDIIRLSAPSNAHACAGCTQSPYSSNIILFSISDPSVTGLSCNYEPSGNCGTDESCIIGLSSETNAHVADCSSKPGSYGAICCSVSGDSQPPTVVNNYGSKAGQWQSSTQTIRVTATDTDSGIDEIRSAWARGDCSQATCDGITKDRACLSTCSPSETCDIIVSENWNEDLCYIAIDKAGNPSECGSVNVKVDLTKPVTSCTNCPENGQVVGEPFVITLAPNDNEADVDKESGIAMAYFCHYRTGDCSYQEYSSPVTVGGDCPSTECTYTIRYYSRDAAGNEESHHERTITYNKDMPTCRFSPELPGNLNARTVHLSWSANDPVTGSTFMSYMISAERGAYNAVTKSWDWTAASLLGQENPKMIETESQTTHDFDLDEDGQYRFKCEVTYDRSGTSVSSGPGLYTVLVDTEAPELHIDGDDPKYVNEETFTISWTPEDINEIARYELKVNDIVVDSNIPASQTSTQYTGEHGNSYKANITAYDLAGNPSQPDEKTFIVDMVAPVCSICPLSQYMNQTGFNLTWSGSDGSGIESYDICFNADGSACTEPALGWNDLESTHRTFTGIHGNTYHFSCRATDHAGNTGEWSPIVNTTIDAEAPKLAEEYNPRVVAGDVMEDLVVNITVVDDAGIMGVSLVIDISEVPPNEKVGDEGDTEWVLVWEIPYDMYGNEQEFVIMVSDVNDNQESHVFKYSVIDCNPGDARECHPVNRLKDDVYNQGVCAYSGNRTCTEEGVWGNCTGGTFPSPEECDGLDNDCDGETDEDLHSKPCGPNTDLGVCEYGHRDCVGGFWSSCVGAVYPRSSEICENDLDDDCDGTVNNGCECFKEGDTQPCGESNIGICRLGTQTCTGGQWGDCLNAIFHSTELCGDGMDNDCDGFTDCDDSDCIGDPVCEGPGPGEDSPWWIFIVIGVAMLAVLAILWYFFKKRDQELTWENLKKRYGSVRQT